MSERPNPKMLFENAFNFTNLGSSRGIANFVLDGPIFEKRVEVLTIAGLLPPIQQHIRPVGYFIVSVDTEKEETTEYHNRILQLKLSRRILDLGINDDQRLRNQMTAFCRQNNYPTSALVFGRYEKSDISVVALYTINGTSPQTSLGELQQRSRERLSTLN